MSRPNNHLIPLLLWWLFIDRYINTVEPHLTRVFGACLDGIANLVRLRQHNPNTGNTNNTDTNYPKTAALTSDVVDVAAAARIMDILAMLQCHTNQNIVTRPTLIELLTTTCRSNNSTTTATKSSSSVSTTTLDNN
jgi:hypothetical protein